MRLPFRKLRVPRNLDDVTSTRHTCEVDPQDLGLAPDAVQRIWAGVQRYYRTGTQPLIALCLRRQGQVLIDRAIGHSHGLTYDSQRPLRRASTDDPVCIFSASKAVTAILMHRLDALNLLRLDDPVAEYIPAFGKKGKADMTIRHVLTHRSGIPSIAIDGQSLDLLADWRTIIDLLCETRPTWAPGRRLAYHAVTGGFILGEIAQRVTGRPLPELLREELAEPLGCRYLSYGVAEEHTDRVAENVFTGLPIPPPISTLVKRALGMSFRDAIDTSNQARYLTGLVPSGNVVATADDLSRFFQLLLGNGSFEGRAILQPSTVRRALTESAYYELDLTLGLPVRYGQGLMLGGPLLSLFGWDTPHAYGHYGFVTIVGWADPERELAGALLTTGKGLFGGHLLPFYAVLSEIARHCPRVRRL
uniref:Esterase n=1 Tax=uncultured delta proteobacterium DeepAnt-32C6 TaxID=357895 RepID=Q2I6M1_9DELT|nr:esterase [uncultured delta proteobacterium DeepAnt-32C6]